MEPILRACDGTWVAQATGDADRDTADEYDRVRVPPDHPQYSLRRVWLTKEEEQGFYFGFANEGLWPLCHIAHTRPTFRMEDWEYYQTVNRKFAEALLEEIKHEDNPVVLVQDYHFALLPRLIRERLPKATIITFWHIPWPNAESFGICGMTVTTRGEVIANVRRLGITVRDGDHAYRNTSSSMEPTDARRPPPFLSDTRYGSPPRACFAAQALASAVMSPRLVSWLRAKTRSPSR